MKRIISIIAVAIVALGLSSCNSKIENPTERNFIGTWDLVSVETIYKDGTVTTSPSKTLDYLVITESTISFYDADKLSRQGKFAVKDNVIYVDGYASYDIENLTRKEMTLKQEGLLGLYTNKYNYKRR